jgi:hypothetical protein
MIPIKCNTGELNVLLSCNVKRVKHKPIRKKLNHPWGSPKSQTEKDH